MGNVISELCFNIHEVLTSTVAVFHTVGSSKQCFTRQWQVMFHTVGSRKQCFTRQAVASNVSHGRQ